MAYSCRILKGAQADYEGIVDYLLNAKENPQAVTGFMDEFNHQMRLVAENPLMHNLSRMSELAALGYRPFFVNDYVVLYFFRNEQVIVAHVFHQLQDYARQVLSRVGFDETLSRLEEWDGTVLTHEQVLASYGCSRATLDSEGDIGFE